MVDVSAATARSRKNSVDQNAGCCILINTSGRVMNISAVPFSVSEPPLSPNDVTAGNIIRPISNATRKPSDDTVTAVRVSLVSDG